MGGYYLALCLHLLGATIWVGGHLVLALSDESLPHLAMHIRVVTALAVVFVLAGASLRVGGYPIFDR